MTQIKINQPIGPDEVFLESSLDGNVGKEIDFKIPTPDGTKAVKAKIVDAKVINEGTALEMTLDIPELDLSVKGPITTNVHHNVFESGQ